MPFTLPYLIPDPIPFNDPDLIIDVEKLLVSYKNRKLSKKRRFEIKCSCGKIFETTLNYLSSKKNIGKCRSCSMKISWENEAYRKSHEHIIRALGSSNESKERGRKQFLKMWSNPLKREEAIRRCHSEKATKKLSNTIIQKLNDDVQFSNEFMARFNKSKFGEHHDYEKNGKFIHLKSKGEFRFVKILDSLSIDWDYEPKGFLIHSLNRMYYPDFFLRNENLWIEIKYSKKQDLIKFEEFLKQEQDIKIIVLFHEDINEMEKLCEFQASKKTLSEMLEILRLKTIITS